MTNESAADAVLRAAVERRIFPGAVAEVGSRRDVLWQRAHGRMSFDDGRVVTSLDTVYDLASLTKPLVTTQVILRLVADHRIALDDRVARYFDGWKAPDRQDVTLRDLLEHASGLSARLLDRPPASRREFEHEIAQAPLEYAPRTRSIYSDLGFILLGFLAADRSGGSLDRLFASMIAAPLEAPADLTFTPPKALHKRTAPTTPLPDDQRAGRVLVGEVHDSYAAALGGVAGHAGLFGTAAGVGVVARAILRANSTSDALPAPFTRDLVTLASQKSTVPGSSRALGWDTMLPSSSCGTRMSSRAFGHVGFTGTSLWIDPARDRYFVLLTNRAAGGGTLDEMREVRRAFHDAAADV